MWRLGLCALAGCEAVFPLDGPPGVELRATFSSVATGSSVIRANRPATVVDGDLLLAIVLADRDLVGLWQADGWDVFANAPSGDCGADEWRVIMASTVATPDTTIEFKFDNFPNWTILVSAYANATSARALGLQTPGTQSDPQLVTFPEVAADRDGVVWIGAVAELPWMPENDPTNTAPVATAGNIAIYDAEIAGDLVVPSISSRLEIGRCAGIAEILIER